jgi:hypothetical protein
VCSTCHLLLRRFVCCALLKRRGLFGVLCLIVSPLPPSKKPFALKIIIIIIIIISFSDSFNRSGNRRSKGKKVKTTSLQTVEAHRFVRRRGSHIFLDNRLIVGGEITIILCNSIASFYIGCQQLCEAITESAQSENEK